LYVVQLNFKRKTKVVNEDIHGYNVYSSRHFFSTYTYKHTDNENIKGLTKKLVYFGWPLKKVGSVGMFCFFFSNIFNYELLLISMKIKDNIWKPKN